ncbi:unnamed protein product [Adineta ricciae]|uniref:Nuclear receptor domain-containing protein n=1 Tax=Adineta ricciae TaxID=249248 RepID=A0A815U7C3_ADIRI|nr:unnamed protein product [Adineta ricciae]CAF1515883.1 unnamed protein product [Adineta ricciae]
MKCKICGDKAIRPYLGILVCPSCRIFFKRNVKTKQTQLKCRYNKNCEINLFNRHICSYCRLKKCFSNGMKSNLLCSSLSKQKSNRIQRNQSEKFPTLNLLRSDQSTLNNDQ